MKFPDIVTANYIKFPIRTDPFMKSGTKTTNTGMKH